MWGLDVMIVNAFLLYTTAHLIIRSRKKDEVLSQYEFRKEISLSWIQKKTAKVEGNDNNDKRGRDDLTILSAGSSIETRGIKKTGKQKHA